MTENAKPEKPYLLVYSSKLGTRDEVKTCLDNIPQISDWRTDLPSSFYILAHVETADELANLISEYTGKRSRFIVVHLGASVQDVQGWVSPDTWRFLGRSLKQK